MSPKTRNKLLAQLEKVWDDGLDFAGAALRGGVSLEEAANGNPYRVNPLTGKRAADDPTDRNYVPPV